MVFECYQQFFKPVVECRVYITNVPSVGIEVQVPPDVQRVLTHYLNLMSKAFDSKTLSGLLNKQNPLACVNRIHAISSSSSTTIIPSAETNRHVFWMVQFCIGPIGKAPFEGGAPNNRRI